MVATGEGRRERDGKFGVGGCKVLHIKWIKNKDLLYGSRNYIHSPGINHNGKEYFKKNEYMYKTESLCCGAEIDTTL